MATIFDAMLLVSERTSPIYAVSRNLIVMHTCSDETHSCLYQKYIQFKLNGLNFTINIASVQSIVYNSIKVQIARDRSIGFRSMTTIQANSKKYLVEQFNLNWLNFTNQYRVLSIVYTSRIVQRACDRSVIDQ